jgi:hypothetical protein
MKITKKEIKEQFKSIIKNDEEVKKTTLCIQEVCDENDNWITALCAMVETDEDTHFIELEYTDNMESSEKWLVWIREQISFKAHKSIEISYPTVISEEVYPTEEQIEGFEAARIEMEQFKAEMDNMSDEEYTAYMQCEENIKDDNIPVASEYSIKGCDLVVRDFNAISEVWECGGTIKVSGLHEIEFMVQDDMQKYISVKIDNKYYLTIEDTHEKTYKTIYKEINDKITKIDEIECKQQAKDTVMSQREFLINTLQFFKSVKLKSFAMDVSVRKGNEYEIEIELFDLRRNIKGKTTITLGQITRGSVLLENVIKAIMKIDLKGWE